MAECRDAYFLEVVVTQPAQQTEIDLVRPELLRILRHSYAAEPKIKIQDHLTR